VAKWSSHLPGDLRVGGSNPVTWLMQMSQSVSKMDYFDANVVLFKCGQSSCKDRPHPASKFLCVASWLLASGCKSDESENRGVGYNFKLKSAIKINPARFVSISVREFHFQFNFKTAVSKIRFQTSPSRLGKLYTQEEFS